MDLKWVLKLKNHVGVVTQADYNMFRKIYIYIYILIKIVFPMCRYYLDYILIILKMSACVYEILNIEQWSPNFLEIGPHVNIENYRRAG